MGESLFCNILRYGTKLAPVEQMGATGTAHGPAAALQPARGGLAFCGEGHANCWCGALGPHSSILSRYHFLLSVSVLMEVLKKLCTCQQRASENMI